MHVLGQSLFFEVVTLEYTGPYYVLPLLESSE